MIIKKLFFICLIFVTFQSILKAEKVEISKAKKVATNWYKHYAPSAKQQGYITKVKEYKYEERTSFYICSFDKGGFVLVSANDAITPVLGYGFEHSIPDTITNEAAKSWFDGYAREIDTAFFLNLKADSPIEKKWDNILMKKFPKATGDTINPLLTTTWGQGWPYNALCPEDQNGSGGHCYTGCVATAYGQILKYYGYPTSGFNEISYTDINGHNLFADFGSTNYRWEDMPSALPNNDTTYLAIAELLYHCGVASLSNYYSATTTGYYVEEPLLNIFDYAYSTMNWNSRNSMTYQEWNTLLKSELELGRPVYYTGSGANGGHAFVCDGFANDEFFHFNIGWGGQANGYYLTSALNFSGYDFSNNQRFLIGIKPNDGSCINNDTTFTGQNHFTTSIYFGANSNVTITPGTSLLFDSACNLKLGGNIIIEGTSENQVDISASDTNSRWAGIRINRSFFNLINNSSIDTLLIKQTNISYSDQNGIYFKGSPSNLVEDSSYIKSLILKNTKLFNNIGFGLNTEFSSVIIDSCDISNNGGGFKQNIGCCLINNSFFQHNNNYGLYINNQLNYCNRGSFISNCNISYNSNTLTGGLYFHPGSYFDPEPIGPLSIIQNNIISYNSGTPGGIRVHGNVLVTGNELFRNESPSYGGGVMVADGAYLIKNSIYANYAHYGGGGVSVTKGKVINNLIYNNSGGIAGTHSVDALIVNNTIANNNSGISFIGIGKMEIKNNILWNEGVEIYAGNNQVNVSRCIIRGGEDNIHTEHPNSNSSSIVDRNPKFIQPTGFIGIDSIPTSINWNINLNSPSIDAAIDDTTGLSIPNLDAYNNNRYNRTLDLGAVENQSDTIVPCFTEDGHTLNSCAGNMEFITIPFRGENCQIQWYFNDSINLGVNNDTLYFNLLSEADSGRYSCIVSNTFGQDTSDYIKVNVFSSPPSNPSAIYGNDTIHHFEKELIYWTHIIPNCPSLKWITSPGLSYSAVNDTTIILMVIDTISTAYIKFFGENPCGTSIDTAIFNLTVLSMPEMLTISGDSTICAGTTSNWWDNMYTTDFNYQYDLIEWQIPMGISAQIYGHYGYMGIYQVDSLASSDTLYARWNKANYGTGQWSPFPLTVIPVILDTAEAIVGSDSVCQGVSSISYSVPIIPDATSYHWIYSGTGVTINGISNSISIDFNANATSGNLTVSGINNCGNGASSENFAISVCELINQSLDLSYGWNITSINLVPEDQKMDSIFFPLTNTESVIKIMDESGNFIQNISGIGWMNTIGLMENTEGYYVKMATDDTLSIIGTKVGLPYPIPLQQGWNIMGYPHQSNQDAMLVLQQLIDSSHLQKVISESGGFIQNLPDIGWINTIGNFKPGEGYYIKLTDNDTLILNESVGKLSEQHSSIIEGEYYKRSNTGNPYLPMHIVAKFKDQGLLNQGDELGAYINDLCIGSVIISDTDSPIVMFLTTNDPTSGIIDGGQAGETINFKLFHLGREYILECNNENPADLLYAPLATRVLSFSAEGLNADELTEMDFYASEVIPNPFAKNAKIYLNMPQSGHLKMDMMDLRGVLIKSIYDYKVAARNMEIPINAKNISSGMYFIKISYLHNGKLEVILRKLLVNK